MADPVQGVGQQAPEGKDGGKAEQNRWPFVQGHQARVEFDLCQFKFPAPARERAGVATELFFQLGEGRADQAQHALLGIGLGLFGAVAQLLQIGQQLGALLVVFQGLDHLIQGLAQRLGCLWLGLAATEHARQAGSIGWD
ncbi:hypothetical protein D3C77_605770 [compost metagenome]